MAVYDEIGIGYDATRRADPYITSRIIHYLDIDDEALYLDAGCGTGNYTVAIASQSKAVFFGIDESEQMIGTARKKSNAIHWAVGDVCSLPFEDNTFSGALCILAIHHFKDLNGAFSEVFRVLSRGWLVIFTSDKRQMEGYWLNEYFPEMMRNSTAKMPGITEVTLALQAAGFAGIVTEPYDVKPDLQDRFLYCGKHRPSMYFDPMIRRGSSGFARFADADEVAKGLERMSRDIASGRIDEVIESYGNDNGDYAFVVAEKARIPGEDRAIRDS
ncbi:MAG: class I SAM-dependent methyltransferase [Actinobacteria bacterium]|jgi:ubiquinone/menaquinone biosynthesis C-methylase UbiE|nr:MAG: class I SAM-dependent methyltransferase [Actinomycetota bacterium]